MTSHLDLSTIHLEKGAHETRDSGVCLLEAVAWFAGREHSDHPPCVSPVLGTFGRAWNDALDDTTRQRLIPYIPRMVGTAGDGADELRAWMLTDWLARVFAPAFLHAAGFAKQAHELEDSPPITGPEAAMSLQAELNKAAKAAHAAWAAVGAAVGAAAGDAARGAAWAAAGAAAREAAGAAVGAAARGAAWDAARAAAGAAGGAALKPTVKRLQENAFDLLGRLCDAGRTLTA